MNRRNESASRRFSRALARGQAMVEYSVITHFLLIGGTILLLPAFTRLLNALSQFYQGMYMVICNAGV